MTEFNRFEEITNPVLAAYNRAVYATNLLEDTGPAVVTDYLNSFDRIERVSIMLILEHVKKYGVDKTHQLINQWVEVNG